MVFLILSKGSQTVSYVLSDPIHFPVPTSERTSEWNRGPFICLRLEEPTEPT